LFNGNIVNVLFLKQTKGKVRKGVKGYLSYSFIVVYQHVYVFIVIQYFYFISRKQYYVLKQLMCYTYMCVGI